MGLPITNPGGEAGDWTRAVAHIEKKQEEMRQEISDVKQEVSEVKQGVDSIHALLVGETVEPEKSMVWRLRQAEADIVSIKGRLDATRKGREKVRNWFLGGAITALGGLFVGWAVSGFHAPWAKSQSTEATSK